MSMAIIKGWARIEDGEMNREQGVVYETAYGERDKGFKLLLTNHAIR